MAENTRDRITFYLPVTLKSEVERNAQKLGQTLSVWLERACRSVLQREEAQSDR